MCELKILHIADTPLVGAPGKIAWMQRSKGHDALSVAANSYPIGGPLEKLFLNHTLLIDDFTQSYIEGFIRRADIIQIHNYLTKERMNWLIDLNQSASFFYQVHSPKREGPLYIDRTEEYAPFEYRAKMVVGQYAGRMYPNFIPVPNVIVSPPSLRRRLKGEKLRVMFSPSHERDGRWNVKHSHKLAEVLGAYSKLGKIEVISPEKPVAPEVLMEVRRSCHVSIDEIATGAFHQVSLEALCAGNIAINRADYFCKATYASFCDGEMPPFLYADEGCIANVLQMIADDWEETVRLQERSYEYFRRYCDPLRLIEAYDEVYQYA